MTLAYAQINNRLSKHLHVCLYNLNFSGWNLSQVAIVRVGIVLVEVISVGVVWVEDVLVPLISKIPSLIL